MRVVNRGTGVVRFSLVFSFPGFSNLWWFDPQGSSPCRGFRPQASHQLLFEHRFF